VARAAGYAEVRRRFLRAATAAVALSILAAGVTLSPAWACRTSAKKCCCPEERAEPGTVRRGCCCAVAPKPGRTVPVASLAVTPTDELVGVASVIDVPLLPFASTAQLAPDVRQARPPPSLLSLRTSFLL